MMAKIKLVYIFVTDVIKTFPLSISKNKPEKLRTPPQRAQNFIRNCIVVNTPTLSNVLFSTHCAECDLEMWLGFKSPVNHGARRADVVINTERKRQQVSLSLWATQQERRAAAEKPRS